MATYTIRTAEQQDIIDIESRRQANSGYSASGYTTKVEQLDRFLETSTANVLVDKVGDDYVINGKTYSQLGEELSNISSHTFSGAPGEAYTDTIPELAVGKTYKITLSKVGNGTLRVYFGYFNNDYTYIESTNNGLLTLVGTVISVASGGITYRDQLGSSGFKIDNISVKELKQITSKPAPFATGTTDELLEDKTYGLTTQVAHSKGDIIVTGNELVTNGTFDTVPDGEIGHDNGDGTVDGWAKFNSPTLSIDANRLKVVQTNNYSEGAGKSINGLVVGTNYTLKFDFVEGTSLRIYLNNTLETANYEYVETYTVQGSKTITFTANAPTMYMLFFSQTATIGNYIIIDNISVRLANTTYIAIQDAPSGTLLTNTSYFKVTPNNDVTRHDVVIMRPSGYDTVKGLFWYTDEDLNNGGWDKVASDYGWTKKGHNTYNDGVSDFFIVGIQPRLNGKMHHPNYNFFGTYQNSSGQYWYNDSTPATSVYSLFAKSVNTTSGRPDSRKDTLFYSGGEGGLISTYNYAKDDVNLRDEANKLVSMSGIESGVEAKIAKQTVASGANTITYIYYNTGLSYSYVSGFVGKKITLVTSSNTVHIATVVSIAEDSANSRSVLTLDISIERLNTYYVFSAKSSTHLTKYSRLSSKVIANPAYLPTFMKNTLSAGKSIHLDMALVNESGTSQIPDGALDTFSFTNTKVNTILSSVRSTDSDTNPNAPTWTAFTPTFSTITNSATMTDEAVGNVVILNATANNKPLIKSVPQQVLDTIDKVFASNSHSIYKGGLVVNSATGKVSVGNGANGFESKVLENTYIPKAHFNKSSGISWSGINGNWYGTIICLDVIGNETDAPNGIGYYVYQGSYIGTISNVTTTRLALTQANGWFYISTTPTHSTITLGNSNSSATKWFVTKELASNNEYCVGIYSQEIGSYMADTGDFKQLTNGTTTDWEGNAITTYHGSYRTGTFKKGE